MQKKSTILVWLSLVVMLALAACGPAAEQTTGVDPNDAMTGTPGDMVPATGQEFDQRFIQMMVPHHQSAVEMARIALERAEHPEIRQMAEQIVSTQEREIEALRGWGQEWYGSMEIPEMSAMPMIGDPANLSPERVIDMQAEVEALRNAQEPFDLAFIDSMVMHHRSAIEAARVAVTQPARPEIQAMAQEIIDIQQTEIDQLNAWRTEWFPDAPPLAMPASH